MVRGEVDHVSAETLKDVSAAKAMEKLALSVDANAQKGYIEKLRGLSREQLAVLLKDNFFDPKRRKFKNYETITKSYVYYGLLEMVLDKLGFDITVTGLGGSKLKKQIVEFERRYGLAVDSGLAGRQVLTTMYGLMQWYTMQPRTPYKTHEQIVNDEEPSKNALLTVDKKFYRKPGSLQAYLRTPEYHASLTGKPRIFKMGIKSGLSRSERREKSHVFFHGSEGHVDGGISMGYYTGKFQYLVLPTGDIVQFGDDDRGHGALGGYPKLFGDASAQKHGIAVELCCPPAKRRVNKMLVNETLEPNPRIIEGANYLVAHLQKKYNKSLNIGLSIDGYLASPTKHTDTLTWHTSTLRELGVSEESIARRNDLLQRRFGVKNPSTLV